MRKKHIRLTEDSRRLGLVNMSYYITKSERPTIQ